MSRPPGSLAGRGSPVREYRAGFRHSPHETDNDTRRVEASAHDPEAATNDSSAQAVLLNPPCDLPCRVRAVLVFDDEARCGGAETLERLLLGGLPPVSVYPGDGRVDVPVFVLIFPNEDEDNHGEVS
jgi:hypothetical protein